MKDNAVSEIIGAVLLIGVVTAAMGIVGVMLIQNIVPTEVPHMEYLACSNGSDIILYHTGGDTLRSDETNSDFYINLLDDTGAIINTVPLMPPGVKYWSAGQVLNISSTLHPTADPRVNMTQIISKTGKGDTLIEWAQVRSCTGTPGGSIPPGPSCLERPYAAFNAAPQTGTAPLGVTFTDESLYDDPKHPITRWEWIFGDGTTDSGKGPITHPYTTEGTYTARLRVHNTCGTDEVAHLITVGGEPCISTVNAKFTTNPPPVGTPPQLTLN